MRNLTRFQLYLATFVIGAGAILPAKAWEYRAPVSPAIAPGFPGAPGQEGRSSFEREDSFPCLYNGQIVVLKSRLVVSKAANINSTGGSAAFSLFGTGVSGGLNSTTVQPNLPEEEFSRHLDSVRADTIISCEALNSQLLREKELDWALKTREVLRRESFKGFAASEEAQDAYRKARKRAGNHHPNLAAADQAANQGRYEEATSLLTKNN